MLIKIKIYIQVIQQIGKIEKKTILIIQDVLVVKIVTKKKYAYIRDNDGWENWSMKLIETYPCLSFYEATKLETYWVKFYNAQLNQTTPQRDTKQYRIDAKEKYRKQHMNIGRNTKSI